MHAIPLRVGAIHENTRRRIYRWSCTTTAADDEFATHQGRMGYLPPPLAKHVKSLYLLKLPPTSSKSTYSQYLDFPLQVWAECPLWFWNFIMSIIDRDIIGRWLVPEKCHLPLASPHCCFMLPMIWWRYLYTASACSLALFSPSIYDSAILLHHSPHLSRNRGVISFEVERVGFTRFLEMIRWCFIKFHFLYCTDFTFSRRIWRRFGYNRWR